MSAFEPMYTLPAMETASTTQQRWMVLDGALLPDLEKQMFSLSSENEITVQYSVLFRATRWDNIVEVGPYLIQYFPQLEAWAHSISPYRYGVIFESSASLQELETHWKTLISCEHAGLEGSLSRLYDAVVMQHLLQSTNETRRRSWLGPMKTLWLPNMLHQHYWQVSLPEHETTQFIGKVLFSDEEWQGLSDAALYSMAWRLMPHLITFFPSKQLSTDVDTHQFIMEQLKDLRTLGTVDQQLAIYYLNIVCQLGAILESTTLYPEIRDILNDHTQSLSQRLKLANSLSISFALNPRT